MYALYIYLNVRNWATAARLVLGSAFPLTNVATW